MSDVPAELEGVLKRSETRPNGLHRQDMDKLRAAIVNSPLLADLITRAARNGSLIGIALSDNPNEAAHYGLRDRLIHLTERTLNDPQLSPQEQGDLLTVALGHETAHALRRKTSIDSVQRFSSEIEFRLQQGLGNESSLDLTAPTKSYLTEFRHGEALAELAGLNALASRVWVENDGHLDPNEFMQRAQPTTSCVLGDAAKN